MSSIPTEPMTVVRLVVDAFQRIRAANVTPTPKGLVLVRGRNDQGKSSLLRSMQAALQGRKATSELPIMEGEHGADVVVDLGQIVVRKHWSRDSAGNAKAELSVTGADGSAFSKPQAVLDALLGQLADPIAFLSMKPEEQVATFLRCIGKGDDVARLERAAKEAYDRRRDVGRDVDRLAKTLLELTREVEGFPPPPTEGTIEELTAQLTAAKDHNARRAALLRVREVAQESGTAAARRVQQLEAQLAAAQVEVETVRVKWTCANEAVFGMVDMDTAPIAAALVAHEQAAKHAAKRELVEQTRTQEAAARADHGAAGNQLEAIREATRKLFAEAQFPMPVGYDMEKRLLLLNGIPFDNASTSERLKLAAIATMISKPNIRVLFVRDGNALDDQRQLELAEIAYEYEFQVWLEMVDSTREGPGFWIEDGEAFDSEPAEPEA